MCDTAGIFFHIFLMQHIALDISFKKLRTKVHQYIIKDFNFK